MHDDYAYTSTQITQAHKLDAQKKIRRGEKRNQKKTKTTTNRKTKRKKKVF